jgi:replicative DNA helicase
MPRSDYFPGPDEVRAAKRFEKKARSKRSQSPDDLAPPHAIEAEQGALGCALLSPTEVLSECEERGVSAEWFYDLRHQVIWHALSELHGQGKPIDLITLQQKLKESGELEGVGGIAYLCQLQDATPSAVNVPFYLQIVREKWTLRRMLQTCRQTQSAIYEWQGEIDPLIAQFERSALALSEEASHKGERTQKEILRAVVDKMENHYNRGKAQITGLVTTGLDYLDKLLGGLGGANGNFDVLTGRPGSGKTSLAMQIAEHAALRHVSFPEVTAEEAKRLESEGHKVHQDGDSGKWYRREVGMPVGVFTLEMADEALIQRALFEQAGADMQRFRTGFMEKGDWARIANAVKEMGQAKLWVDEECFQIESLRAKARRWHRQHGVRLFIIDYLQLLISADRRRYENRNAELTEICAIIRRLSKQLNVPFLVLAQMNRDFEKEPNRKPRLSDLKDCGAIEQDADLVMMLYQPKLRDTQEAQWDEACRERIWFSPHCLNPFNL